MKRVHIAISLLALSLGCSMTERVPSEPSHQLVTESGGFRLTVTDQLGAPGMAFTLPDVKGESGKVTVVARRYGSLCTTAVSGHAEVVSNAITLTIVYEERLAMCTKELRHLIYRAEVLRLAPGQYDVTVVHDDRGNNTHGPVVTRRVSVS